VHVGIAEWETGERVARHFTYGQGADIYGSHMENVQEFFERNLYQYHKTTSRIYIEAT
jgi:hypothetical protein